jgi:hypothetical protein
MSTLDSRPEYLSEGRNMAQDAELETKIAVLCDEANAMLLASRLDTQKALVLRNQLLEYADLARKASLGNSEQLLRKAAAELAARFPAAA